MSDSVKLDAIRMKNNDPTLPTCNTTKTWLFQLKEKHIVRCAYRQYTIEFKTRKEDPSLMNTFQRKTSEPTLQYESSYKPEETGQTQELVPHRIPSIFKSQNNFLILDLPFTYNDIFRSVYFQDQPKVIISFKT